MTQDIETRLKALADRFAGPNAPLQYMRALALAEAAFALGQETQNTWLRITVDADDTIGVSSQQEAHRLGPLASERNPGGWDEGP
jgi:hypothetical protein